MTIVTDAEQNTIEARIPRAVCDPGTQGRMLVAAGLWDPDAGAWYRPAADVPPYFDLAYTPGEGMLSYWRDVQQANDLASGDLPDDRLPVDFSLLSCRRDCPAAALQSEGLFTRVFRSGQDLGEGIAEQIRWGQHESFDWFVYRSRYQPYAVYVPPEPSGALVLLLHYLGGNHMSYAISSWPGLRGWADPLGAIVAMPLGRGEAGWYEGEAERDVFEVWRDVATHHPVDPERVYLAGMSMGGFGAWRLGLLYPDRFARAIVWSGPVTPYSVWPYPAPVTWPQSNPPMCEREAEGCGYTLADLFPNGHNLPYLVIHGGADELVPATGPEAWLDAFRSAGGQYRYVLYPTRRHETTFPGATVQPVLEWLAGSPSRDGDPVHVGYRVVRDLFDPAHGLSYDGAYWVDGMQLAGEADVGSIDAALGGASESGESRAGVDALGPYLLRGRRFLHVRADAPVLTVSARSLARAEIDTARIGWIPLAINAVVGTTDSAIDLVLRGDFPGDVTVSGSSFRREGSDVVLQLERGDFEVIISPA